MFIGNIPNKRKVSLSTRLYMKWKKIELGWRRYLDPEMREANAKAIERRNPFHPSNKRK